MRSSAPLSTSKRACQPSQGCHRRKTPTPRIDLRFIVSVTPSPSSSCTELHQLPNQSCSALWTLVTPLRTRRTTALEVCCLLAWVPIVVAILALRSLPLPLPLPLFPLPPSPTAFTCTGSWPQKGLGETQLASRIHNFQGRLTARCLHRLRSMVKDCRSLILSPLASSLAAIMIFRSISDVRMSLPAIRSCQPWFSRAHHVTYHGSKPRSR